MTKLQLLHRALNERLMAAVEQIMEMVGGTVLEYEEETVRARKENEILRRRLRWMEGENPTDWPDPTNFSVPGETSLTDALAIESLIIKTEPIDSHDFQLYGPESSFTASVCTASMGIVYPGTSASADEGIPGGIVWDSAQSYMAPLDSDPTLSTMVRNRSQRRSFACPDCGKVFGREQRLMFHMRVHSTERPYTYRRRKACFYGDKKQKKKLRGLSKTSREFIEDLSDTSEQTEQSAVSVNVGTSTSAGPSAPEFEPSEASDEASGHTSSSSSSKLSETSLARPGGLKAKQGREKPKTAQCLQCNKAFTNVSRLAVHMKTHTKPVSTQYEQNAQGHTDRTDGNSHHQKAIRNNDTEVEKAKAIGQRLFQCPECNKIFARSCWLSFHLKSHERERKRQKIKELQNNKLKDVPKVLEKPKKDVATDDSKVSIVKKIFACPYCDKVFSREGWLGPHIRSHTTKKQKSDIISDAILPNSTKRRARRGMTKSSGGGNKQKKLTEQTLEKTVNSDVLNDTSINDSAVSQNITMEIRTNPETKIIITNNLEDTRSESQSNSKETLANNITEESKPVLDELSLVPEESIPVPEESLGKKGGDKKYKKRFPCRECGKVYLMAGWLKTHKKMHKKKEILEGNTKQQTIKKEFGQNNDNDTEESIKKELDDKKKQKKKKKSQALEGSLDVKKKKKNHLTNALLLEAMDKSSNIQTGADKSKESGATSRKCVCNDCGKVYARKNWLSLHMLGHRKALMALPQKANDETPKNDGQMTQEGSSTEESKGQKGKDSSKATFPCPFCDKVFPRAMRLMVHMQIHSGEKPYPYRQRKEQFYTEPTRPRMPETEKQEPAIEGNDEKSKDEGNEVTRSQTSQDHASTTEETIQPQSVRSDRQFSLLPLQSSDAATIQSTALKTSELKSVHNFSLKPRIVLDSVMAETSHSPPSKSNAFKQVSLETSDIHLHRMPDLEISYAATGEQVKSHLSQTSVTKPNPPASQTSVDLNTVCVTASSADTFYENTACSEKLFVSVEEQLSSKSPVGNTSEISKRKGHVGPQLLQMDIEASSSAVQQESGYMVLSDVSDDDERADVFVEKKEIKILIPLMDGPADATAVQSFPPKSSNSDVTIMLGKTDKQNVLDGRHDLAVSSAQKTEEQCYTEQKRRFSCLTCGLTFAAESSLTQHMKVHSVSAGTFQSSNSLKTLKKRVKNNVTKPKQEVQTSEVGSADSKDNSEISGNSDPSLTNASTAKVSGIFPDFGATDQSFRSYSETFDRKSKKEILCCCYCGKLCEKLELHLMHDHPKEPRVIEALHCSNTIEDRKRLLKLYGSKKGLKTTRNEKDGAQIYCVFCQNCYPQNLFWNHTLICEQKQSGRFSGTEPGSSIDPANPSLRLRPSLAHKSFHPESGNFIKDLLYSTVRQATPQSVKLSSATADHYTSQYLYSVSTVSETGSTKVNPDPGSESMPVVYTGNSSAMMSLKSESSGPLPLESSSPSTVQKAFANSQKLTLKAKRNLEKEHQSEKRQQPCTSLSSSLYLLDAASINLYQDAYQDCSHTQALNCSGKPVTPQDSARHIHTGGSDSQFTIHAKSDWTTIPTVHMDLEHLGLDKEPNRTIMMTEPRSEWSAVSNPHSESTRRLDLFSIKAQDFANPETSTISIPLFRKKYPEAESHCELIRSHFSSEKQHETKEFDSDSHVRDDTGDGSTYTGKDIDLKSPGKNVTVTIERSLDSESWDTKRGQQSDSLQTSAEERKASAVTSQTPEMKCSLQISNTRYSLKNSKAKAQTKLTTKHCCYYCKKPSKRMAQHLLLAHAREPEVEEALSYDKKSRKRKLLLDLLQNKFSCSTTAIQS